MFTNEELKKTKEVCELKINDVLERSDGSDLDYIRDLQTLIGLKDMAEQKLRQQEE